jgi:putative endonuclease
MASGPKGTLYVGVTSKLPERIAEHKTGNRHGFTARYGVKRLVFVEEFQDINDALVMEKRVKRWRRQWKIELIEKSNPGWRDLAANLL